MEEMTIREKVENLTEILFCAENSGPETLLCMRHWFREIRLWAGKKSQTDIMVLSHAAAKVVDRMIRGRMDVLASALPAESDTLTREDIRNSLLDELIEASESDIPFMPLALGHDVAQTVVVI